MTSRMKTLTLAALSALSLCALVLLTPLAAAHASRERGRETGATSSWSYSAGDGASVIRCSGDCEDGNCASEHCLADDCQGEDCAEDCLAEDSPAEDCDSEHCIAEDCQAEDCASEGCVAEDCQAENCQAEGCQGKACCAEIFREGDHDSGDQDVFVWSALGGNTDSAVYGAARAQVGDVQLGRVPPRAQEWKDGQDRLIVAGELLKMAGDSHVKDAGQIEEDLAAAAEQLNEAGDAHTHDVVRLEAALAKVAAAKDRQVKVIRNVVLARSGGSFLGVGVADIDEERAKTLGLREEYGVEVKSVVPDSGAGKAGLKDGDVVLEYNGQRIEGTAQFVRMVQETPVGREVKLLVLRDGRNMALSAVVGKRAPRIMHFRYPGRQDDTEAPEAVEPPEPPDTPDTPEAPEAPETNEDFEIQIPDMPEIHIPDMPSASLFSWKTPLLGVETEAIGSQLAEFFGVKEGVLVRSVLKNSAAERAGLKAGDVITKIGDKKVSRPGEVSSALRSQPAGEGFPITLIRNRKEMTVTAKLDQKTSRKARPRANVVVSGDEDSQGL